MSTDWQCPRCQATNPVAAKFCGSCGAPAPIVAAGEPVPAAAASPPGVYIGQPQVNTPGYAGPAAYNPAAPPAGDYPTKNYGFYAVGCAILALVCCGFVSGIPGMILAKMQLDAIRDGRCPATEKTMALAGMWGCVIGTVVNGCGTMAVIFMMMMGGRM